MNVSLRVGASQLDFLFLVLFLPFPPTVSPHPLSPTVDPPNLEAALLNLQSALEGPQDEMEEGSWEGPRAQRRLVHQPPSAFLENQVLNYQEGGDGDDGWMKSDALTSMAGGLQAVNRQKGGFLFRFGKKRWTDESRGGRGEEAGFQDGGGD